MFLIPLVYVLMVYVLILQILYAIFIFTERLLYQMDNSFGFLIDFGKWFCRDASVSLCLSLKLLAGNIPC